MASGDSSDPAFASLRAASPFRWPRDISAAERKTLIAGGLGWMLDAMDVMLYSFVLADRLGRTRALMASILVYSFSSAACGLSVSIPQLAAFRFLLGLGMGGEWSSGAALVAETWRPEHRGRALGLMQSTYAIGEALAAVIVLIVFPRFGWRVVFFVGVLPALLVLWIYRGVPEPELWKNRAKQKESGALQKLLQKDVLRNG